MGNERRGRGQATLPAQLIQVCRRPDELGPLRSPGCTGCLSPSLVPLETEQSEYSESWKKMSTTQVGTELPSTQKPAEAVTNPSLGGGAQARRLALSTGSLQTRAVAPTGASNEEIKKRSLSQTGSSSFFPLLVCGSNLTHLLSTFYLPAPRFSVSQPSFLQLNWRQT